MRAFLKIVVAVVVGTALGLGVTWFTIVRGASMGGDIADGPWHTSLLTGSSEGGMALRAAVALHGLFALNRHEAIYYTALTDSAGNKLDGACRYLMTGHDMPTRWWSVTAYGSDDFLIPNAGNRYAVSMNSVSRDKDGAFTAHVSPKATDEIVTAPGPFSLTLRLYNPDPKVAADPARVVLPTITRESCP